MASDLNELIGLGTKLGLKDQDLKDFVTEQQKVLREERAIRRAEEKEREEKEKKEGKFVSMN